MDEKKEISEIISNYTEEIVRLYKRILKIQKENQNRTKDSEIRKAIMKEIEEVVK
jgi:hypothetical protein